MKKILRSLVFLSACSWMLPTASLWGQEQGSAYVKLDLGGTWMPDADLREFFGAESPGAKVRFSPGFRAGFRGGFNVTDWFAPEFETGYMGNWIDSISGATEVDSYFSNVPFLVNARFQLPNRSRIWPYIGGGVGGSVAMIDSNFIEINGVSVEGYDSTAVFAYQAFAGIRIRINERMSAGVEYRYFATDSPTWEAHDFHGGFPGSDKMSFGHIQTHAVSAVLDFTF